MTTPPTHYRSGELADQAGITNRQVNEWCSKGFIHPTQPLGRHSGRQFTDLERRITIRMAMLYAVGFTPRAASTIARTWETDTPGHATIRLSERVAIATGSIE
jgi:DNA-binding transcriptional MerR regulator